jgi:[ribosomal protein S5]-alanine N-acetyltransferase
LINPSTFYHNLPSLTTDRLVLRRLRLEDAQAYFAFAGDPLVTRYLRWGPHGSIAETESYLAGVMEGYASGCDGPWGIELARAQALVGTIHLMAIDPQHRTAEVGVVVARTYWGQGIGPEALRRVLALCFNELGLNRVQGLVVVGNAPGRRMMEKCAMVHEGTLREYAVQKGQPQNFDVYALLAREFWAI